MHLNLPIFFLICWLPLVLGYVWYNIIMNRDHSSIEKTLIQRLMQVIILYILSIGFVFALMNLTIHQIGYYELFFTDIMKGSAEAKSVTEAFLTEYGAKHRYFSHGVFHGVINGLTIPVPIIIGLTYLGYLDRQYLTKHITYWVVTCALVCGLLAEFV